MSLSDTCVKRWCCLQGPSAGDAETEPPQLAALLLCLQPPPLLTLHPGGAAGHPALHPSPAEDPPARAAAGRGPEPPLGRRGRSSPALRSTSVYFFPSVQTTEKLF